MKAKKIEVEGVIGEYLPADYADSFAREIRCGRAVTPRDFMATAFGSFPGWIGALLKLRNVLVKPFGLDTGSRFSDCICAESPDEILFGMPDKHLSFHASLHCGAFCEGRQLLRITTVVTYNNWFGRAYFFFIRPFHCIIMRSLLKKVEKRYSGGV